MAAGLAETGANIIGVSASLEASGSAIEKAVTALGRTFKAHKCDFSVREALYAFIKSTKAENGTPDILVNNAGTILREPAATHSDEYWDKVIEVNQSAQFILAREFWPGYGSPWQWEDHLHGVPANLPGRDHRTGLCGLQGSDRATDHGAL